MSSPFKPPSRLSPMNYSRAALGLGSILALLGLFTITNGGVSLIGVGGLLLIMAGMMNDIQRNYVGLVLLAKAAQVGDEAQAEFGGRLESLEAQIHDLSMQHNPIVNEIESVQAEVVDMKRELAWMNIAIKAGA